MYYRETSAARTELAQGTEAKVRTQNFRKAPRQRDRSLRKKLWFSLCGVVLTGREAFRAHWRANDLNCRNMTF